MSDTKFPIPDGAIELSPLEAGVLKMYFQEVQSHQQAAARSVRVLNQMIKVIAARADGRYADYGISPDFTYLNPHRIT